MQKINDFNFAGKKAIVRVDFNVPLNENFEITDDTRIRGALPTLKKILNDGGSAVIMSHLGRPKDGPEEKFSLKHVIPGLKKYFPDTNIQFANDSIGEQTQALKDNLNSGEILILENLRFYKQENKDKEGMKGFAEKLAQGTDVYVNDAFGTAHRAHASTAIIAEFFDDSNKMFGFLIDQELEAMDRVLNSQDKPFTAIMGGAKVSDKIEIVETLLPKIDNLIIGGGMAYTFVKALGGSIGKSLCEDDKLDLALEILEKAKQNNVEVFLPTDTVIADDFSPTANTKVSKTDEIDADWEGLDIGEDTREQFKSVITNSRTVLWNGPMGVFEFDLFANGTKSIAVALAEATSNNAFTLVGGGDSVAAVNKMEVGDKVSYVSTGGGAMLEYMEGKVLPGIKAIRGK